MPKKTEKDLLLRELSNIAKALGETFAPYCEVIISDLSSPDHVVVQVENSLSGREVGDAASLIGLARLTDPSFPDIMTNLADAFRDGRPVKSTSIGIRDSSGKYVAALYINIDISYIRSVATYLNELIKVNDDSQPLYQTVSKQTGTDFYAKIAEYAARRNREPRSLTTDEKRELVQQLEKDGDMQIRGAAEKIASVIGVTRTQIYYYLKNEPGQNGTGKSAPKRTKAKAKRPRRKAAAKS